MTEPDLPARCCATCRHAHKPRFDIACRRYPPVPVYGSSVARFPQMEPEECCGEWAGAEPEAAPAPDADTGGAAFLRTRLLLAQVLYGEERATAHLSDLSTPERIANVVRLRLRRLTAALGVP